MCQLEPTNVVLAHPPHYTHMCTFLQDLLRSQASVAPPSSRGSSLLEILLWIDISSQINPETKPVMVLCSIRRSHNPPPCPVTVGRILTSPAQQFGAKTEEDTNPNAKMLKMLRHHYHCYRLPLQAILRW